MRRERVQVGAMGPSRRVYSVSIPDNSILGHSNPPSQVWLMGPTLTSWLQAIFLFCFVCYFCIFGLVVCAFIVLFSYIQYLHFLVGQKKHFIIGQQKNNPNDHNDGKVWWEIVLFLLIRYLNKRESLIMWMNDGDCTAETSLELNCREAGSKFKRAIQQPQTKHMI